MMLTFLKSFQWISKGFCLIFFQAVFACHFNFKTRLEVMKNIFTIRWNALLLLKDKIFKVINIFTMKEYISYTGSFRPQYLFVVLLMFLGSFPLFAQRISGPAMLVQHSSLQEQNVVLAFNSPFSYTLPENVSWELKDENESLILSSKGDINGHVFSKPGSYTLHIHEDRNHDTNACEHAHFPERVKIEVKPVKLDFDFSTIRFSKDITGGQPANGITISVKVNYSSYDNSTSVYNQGLTSFGVGSTVSGKLKNGEATLKPGVNTLEFVLEGQAEAGNNIQLNFTDFIGEVQPYTLTPKIQ